MANLCSIILLLFLSHCSFKDTSKLKLEAGRSCSMCNYKFSNFSHLDLSHTNLSGSYFFGAILYQTKLDKAILQSVNFMHAIMTSLSAREAKISHIQAAYAGLMSADFSFVTGKFPNFDNSDLNRGSFMSASLVLPSFDRIQGLGINFKNATIINGSFQGAQLRDSDFCNANVRQSTFKFAVLKDADLSNSSMIFCDFSGADLGGANLTNADLSFSDLRGANLSGATLEGANLHGVKLCGAILPSGIVLEHCRPLDVQQLKHVKSKISNMNQEKRLRR